MVANGSGPIGDWASNLPGVFSAGGSHKRVRRAEGYLKTIDTKNDGLENVSPSKHGYFGYLYV